MTGYDKAAAAKNEYKDGLNVSESSNKSADKNTENIKLLKRVKQGDAAARDELINGNVGLVRSIIKRFLNRGAESEDLFQIGCIGLIKAVEKFDLSYGVQFSTYAVPMIIGEIKRFLRDDGIIKVSRSYKDISSKAMAVKEKLTAENDEEPTVKKISEVLGISPEELAAAMEASQKPESLYRTIDDGSGKSAALIDRLESDENYEEAVENRLLLKEALSELPEREQKIIILRYYKQKTQSEIAKILGISQVQVSRIEKKVLRSMRDKIT